MDTLDSASIPMKEFSANSLKKNFSELSTSGNIYSSIGHDVLLCSDTDDARFREVNSEVYVSRLRDANETSGHPYFFLHDVYRALLETRQHQSVVFSGKKGDPITRSVKACLAQFALILPDNDKNASKLKSLLAATVLLDGLCTVSHEEGYVEQIVGRTTHLFFSQGGNLSGAQFSVFLLDPRKFGEFSNQNGGISLLRAVRNDPTSGELFKEFGFRDIPPSWEEDTTVPTMVKMDRIIRALGDVEASPTLKRHFLSILLALNMLHEVATSREFRGGKLDDRRLKYACDILELDSSCLINTSMSPSPAVFQERIRSLCSSLWRSMLMWWCGYFNKKFEPKTKELKISFISPPSHEFGQYIKDERMLFTHAAHEFLNNRAFDHLIVKRESLFAEHKLNWTPSQKVYDTRCIETLLEPKDGLIFFLAEKATARIDRRKLITTCRELALLSDDQSEIRLNHPLGSTVYNIHHIIETYCEDILDEPIWNSLLKSKNPLIMALLHFGEFVVDITTPSNAAKSANSRQTHQVTVFTPKEAALSSTQMEIFDVDLVNSPSFESQISSMNEWRRMLTSLLTEMRSIEDSSFRLVLHFQLETFDDVAIANYGLDTLSRIHALGFPVIRDYHVMLQSIPELSVPLLKEKPGLKESPKDACKIILDRLGRSHGFKLTGTKIFMTCGFVEELRAICLESRVYDINGTNKQDLNDSALMNLQNVVLDMGINNDGTFPSNQKKGINGDSLISAMKDSMKSEETKLTRSRKFWLGITWMFTWWIPDCILSCCGMKERPMRIAWREKVALCSVIMMLSGGLLFWITGFAGLICPTAKAHQWKRIEHHSGEQSAWIGIHGKVVDVTDYLPYHYGGRKNILPFLGRDVSVFFPLPSLQTMGQCIHNVSAGQRAEAKRSKECVKEGFKYCHTSAASKRLIKKYTIGDVAYDTDQIKNNSKINQAWFTFHNKVYNVTQYLMSGDLYLRTEVNRVIINHLGEDATAPLMQFKDAATLEACFDNLFYAGRISEEYGSTCRATDVILLASVGGVVFIMVFKFLTALQLSAKRSPEHHDKFVLLTVPCYTESEASLRKTLDSLSVMEYDDNRKLLMIIADGMITGSGNDRPTPKIVLDILGSNPAYDPPVCEYQALGEGMKQLNYAKVYSGLYYCAGHRVPYLVIVKVGKPNEQVKPGNRGKRDSQLILLKFLNKIQYDLPMNPLELQIYQQINDVIGVDPNLYEFMMTVDADTEVKPDSLNRMISCMLHDTKIMALCGETEVANDKSSWVTMIQVYEYYMSHHISKAFESLFGSVTCLPGCFSLYRIKLPIQNMAPCLTLPEIIQDYSENNVDTLHMKNLLHLGEDRYLTTLMLKYFPHMKLSFTSDAQCRTVVPETWNVLLSQRRRWINSTVHNFLELLKLKELCGFCLFSMRFVVLMDLLATLIMPAFVGYMFYLIYVSIRFAQVPLLSLIIFCAMYGLQAILFLIKKQWQNIGWMVIYVLAIPIFHLIIPLYAFWHFDDFSWGRTRRIQGVGGEKDFKILDDEERQFEPSLIPMKKLSEIERERWDQASQSDDASVQEEYSRRENDKSSAMDDYDRGMEVSRELSHDQSRFKGHGSLMDAPARFSVMKMNGSNDSMDLVRQHGGYKDDNQFYHERRAPYTLREGLAGTMSEMGFNSSWNEPNRGHSSSLAGHQDSHSSGSQQYSSMYPIHPPIVQNQTSLDDSSFYSTQQPYHSRSNLLHNTMSMTHGSHSPMMQSNPSISYNLPHVSNGAPMQDKYSQQWLNSRGPHRNSHSPYEESRDGSYVPSSVSPYPDQSRRRPRSYTRSAAPNSALRSARNSNQDSHSTTSDIPLEETRGTRNPQDSSLSSLSNPSDSTPSS